MQRLHHGGTRGLMYAKFPVLRRLFVTPMIASSHQRTLHYTVSQKIIPDVLAITHESIFGFSLYLAEILLRK